MRNVLALIVAFSFLLSGCGLIPMEKMEEFGRYLTQPEQAMSQSDPNPNSGSVASKTNFATKEHEAEKIEKTTQTIKIQVANLREFPGLTASVLAKLKKDTPVEVLDVLVDEETNFIWCYVKVKTENKIIYGWIAYTTIDPDFN